MVSNEIVLVENARSRNVLIPMVIWTASGTVLKQHFKLVQFHLKPSYLKKKKRLCQGKKQGLKRPNTSMSVPLLALYKWAIKHKRNRKPQKHKRDQICIVPF